MSWYNWFIEFYDYELTDKYTLFHPYELEHIYLVMKDDEIKEMKKRMDRIKNHWVVKGKGVLELYGNSPNGTQADSWSWENRYKDKDGKYTIDEGVVYCSKTAIDCVKQQPGIDSVEPCNDPDKCFENPPYEIPKYRL